MKKQMALFFLAVLALLLLLMQVNTSAQTPATNASSSGGAVSNAGKATDSFDFPGGSPRQLLEAVQKQYQVDWLSLADMPREMENVRVPRFRIDFENTSPGLHYRLTAILNLYNRMGQDKPELGKLIVEPEPHIILKPSVVLLVPDKSATAAKQEIKIKAFPIRALHRPDWKKIEDDIRHAADEARSYDLAVQLARNTSLHGDVSIHDSTGLLVAYGSQAYVDLVESIVQAYQANQNPTPNKWAGADTEKPK